MQLGVQSYMMSKGTSKHKIQVSKGTSKSRVARWRCIPEFLLLRGVRFVGGVWQHEAHQHHKGSPYSPVATPQRLFHDPLRASLWRRHKSFTQSVGAIHNSLGGSQPWPRTLRSFGAEDFLLGFQETLGHKPQLSPPRILVKNSNWCTKCNGKNNKCSSPSLPNPNTTTNAMEEYERKNKKEINKMNPKI